MPKLTLVIPCYNEAANLPSVVDRCNALVARRPDVEIILVDNGSFDGTPETLRELLPNSPGCRSTRVEVNRGFGYGVLAGLGEAKTRFLGWTHADMQTDPLDVIRGLEIFEKAERPEQVFVKGGRYGRPLFDVVFTTAMSAFESMLFGCAMWDINAQPVIFSREFFESWKSPPYDFALELYAYQQAKRQGLRVERFPVLFGPREHGQSHWNVGLRGKAKFIKRTVSYSFKLRHAQLRT